MALSFETFKELYIRIQNCDFESDRKLAAEYGVNRNCIYLIRQGKHKYSHMAEGVKSKTDTFVYPSLDEEEALKYTRCPTCRNKVQAGIPCFICTVRNFKASKINKFLEKNYG